jgi:ribosomal protein S18 acetylase RimI-like enzyme
MATIAVARGERGIVARTTNDRALLREFLEHDRLYAAYALCDLDDREYPRTRWAAAYDGGDRGDVVAVGMEYSGLTPQPLFLMGTNDGIVTILRDVLRPRVAYLAAKVEAMPAVESLYRVDPGPQMVRMWVDRAHFRPYPAQVRRLLPSEIGELNRLYQLGFASWLPASAIAEGVYFGMRVGGKLIAAAGTHVISPEARLAVVGNVLTHAEHRGRGYATAVTGAVTAELLLTSEQVVLNVRADNPPALQAYRRLGYVEHLRFEERLVHRIGSPWPDFAGPLRRFFSSRNSSRNASRNSSRRETPHQ